MADPSVPVSDHDSDSEVGEIQPPGPESAVPLSSHPDVSEPIIAEREISDSESEPEYIAEAVLSAARLDVSDGAGEEDQGIQPPAPEPAAPVSHPDVMEPIIAEREVSDNENENEELEYEDDADERNRFESRGRTSTYGGSVRLQYRGQRRQTTDDDHLHEPQNSRFAFLEELPIHTGFRNRAQKAVKAIADEMLQEVQKPDEEEEEKKCCQCLKRSEKESSATLTPQLKRASSQGFKMLKKILFPSLPKFLRDLWVGTELVITIIAFVLAVVSFPDSLEETKVISTISLILSILSIILALIDGYIYFFQLGSLAECIHTVRGKLKERRQHHNSTIEEDRGHEEPQNGLEDDQQDEPAKKWWQLSPEWKEKFDTWFELVRNLTSEAILYPLLVCDLFDVIAGGTFAEGESVDLGFFVAGSFYLVVAVYFMRLLMVIGNLISLRRVPMIRNSSGSAKDQQTLMGKFCVHILAQIFVHLMAIIAVATKISDENLNVVTTNETDSIHASPFLIVNVVLGGIVPISGVLIFFLANYFWMKEFSVSFWIDMMSLLQAPSFADTVFDHDTDYKDKTLELIEKTEFGVVKDHFSTFKSTAYHTKFLYPLRIPILVVLGLLYEISLIVFMASLVYSTDSVSGEVKFVLFGETRGLTAIFFILGVLLVIANIHILILVNLWLVGMLMFLVAASITVIVVAPFIILVYLPSFLGFYLGWFLSWFCTQCMLKLVRKKNIYEVERGSNEIMMEDLKLKP